MVGKSGRVTEVPGVSAMPVRLNGIAIIESTTHPELQRLADKYKLDIGNLTDALDINEAPRLEHRDNYDYLFVRLPNPRRSVEVSQTTQPLLLVYNDHVLLVITGAKMSPIIENTSLVDDLSSASTITDALLCVLFQVVASFDFHIKKQTDTIHGLVNKIQKHRIENEDYVNLILIEDQINNFTSSLTPLVPLFNRLQADRDLRLSASTNDMLTDIILATQQSISVCDANAKRIASIRDAYTTISSDSLNRVMKTLTIATLLIAAPNLVFSMFGMNIHLPVLHSDVDFFLVLTLAIIITIIIIIWGRKKRMF